MTLIRWIFGILIGLLVIVVAGVILVVNFVNPNDFRDEINKKLSEATQQTVNIQGDIKWIFFPELGLSVQNIHVGDKEATPNLSADINHVDVHLKIWPLLHKEVKVSTLKLNGVNITLPIAKNEDATKKNTFESIAKAGVAAFAFLPMLDLMELDINDASINHRDNKGVIDWHINHLDLQAVDLKTNEEIPLTLSLTFNQPTTKLEATIKLATKLLLHEKNKQVSLKEFHLWVKTPSNSALPISFSTEIHHLLLDLNTNTLQLDAMTGKFNQLNFSGKLSAENLTDRMHAEGNIQLQTQTLKNFLTSLNISLPATQNSQAFSTFEFSAPFNYNDNQLTLNPFTLKMDHNILKGSLSSSDLANLALQIKTQDTDLILSDYLPPSTSPHKLNINDFQFYLSALPPMGSHKDWLTSTVTTNLSMQKINFDQFVIQDIATKLEAKNGLLKFNQLHAKIWQGTIDAIGSADITNNQPRWTLAPKIQGIQISDILHILEPKINLTGVANIQGTIAAQSFSPDTIKKTLTGTLNILVSNGMLHGIDLNYWLSVGSTLIHHDGVPSLSGNTNATKFGTLTATAQINQGVVDTPDILLKGDVIQMNGKGITDLNRESLNYNLQIRKTNVATGGAHNDIVPLVITGTYSNPNISVDMNLITKQVLSNQKDHLANKIGQQISKKLGGDGALGDQISQLANKGLGSLIDNL